MLRATNIEKILKLPKFLILVRDPRDILVSAFEKAKGPYLDNVMNSQTPVDFSQFLRADMDLKKPFADIWSIILFFNAWGALQHKPAEQYQFMTYENVKENTLEAFKSICNFIGIEGINDRIIHRAIENSSRQKMKKKLNPDEEQAEKSVNLRVRNFKDWYNDEDQKFVNDIFSKYLKYNFGYTLNDWT